MACGLDSRPGHMNFLHKKNKDIYLDSAAATPVSTKVSHTMRRIEKEYFANPDSIHKKGLETKAILEKAREGVADFIHAHEREIVFTSGSTESIVTAMQGTVEHAKEIGEANV